MIPYKEDFEYFIALSQRAIKTSVLAQLAWSAPSPTAAFKMARNSGWDYKAALSCRNLAIIRRDWGNDYFKAVVSAGRMYYSLGSENLCFCTCHQCRKCFKNHNHDADKCDCTCHKCKCCTEKFCFCSCHESIDGGDDANGEVCKYHQHCDKCLTPLKVVDQYTPKSEEDYEEKRDDYNNQYEDDYYEDDYEDDGYYGDNDEEYYGDNDEEYYGDENDECYDEEEDYEEKEESEEVDMDEDRETPKQIEKSEGSPVAVTDPFERLQSVVERIEQTTGKKLKIEYVDSDNFVAQVDKSDRISLSRGLIEAAGSDDELAFVISHELSHSEENHIEQINESAEEILEETAKIADKIKGGIVKRVLGKGLVMAAGVATAVVVSRDRSRRAEKEADAEALDIMVEAGFNPKAAEEFLAKYEHDYQGFLSELLSTHPTAAERIDNLRRKRKI